MIHDLVFIIVVLIAIVRGLYQFFRWATRGLSRLSGSGPGFTPQAMPPQQRPPLQPQPRPMLGQPAPMPPRADLRAAPPRRPDAGGPAVLGDATTAQFRAQEAQIQRSEAEAYAPPQATDAASPTAPDKKLFTTTDDLVRAFIFQEVLGPPLCRRPRR